MSLFNNPPKEKKDFEITPAGMHPGICYSIVDLGTHPDTWKGVTTNKRKVRITWELETDPMMKDGRPFVISKDYTLSPGKFDKPYIANTSGLFSMLKTWMGWSDKEITPGNLCRIIGQPGLVSMDSPTPLVGK